MEFLISKERFSQIIKRLCKYRDMENQINSIFRNSVDKYEQDFIDSATFFIGHESVVVDLLKQICYDKDEWIEWWLYECDYGKEIKEDSVRGADGKPISVKTPEELYDLLVTNQKKYEEWKEKERLK